MHIFSRKKERGVESPHPLPQAGSGYPAFSPDRSRYQAAPPPNVYELGGKSSVSADLCTPPGGRIRLPSLAGELEEFREIRIRWSSHG